jgi:hypothetical protein
VNQKENRFIHFKLQESINIHFFEAFGSESKCFLTVYSNPALLINAREKDQRSEPKNSSKFPLIFLKFRKMITQLNGTFGQRIILTVLELLLSYLLGVI